MQKVAKKRIYSFDALRAFAISLVCWGHCIQVFHHDNSYWSNPVWELIYSFHMPLFFFVSGYFLKNSVKKLSFFAFLKKKIIVLLIPYFSWQIIRFIIILIKKKGNFISLYSGGGIV